MHFATFEFAFYSNVANQNFGSYNNDRTGQELYFTSQRC